MQFHGIGREEHSAHTHQVTTCMHDHSHYKMETDGAKAAASMAKTQSMQAAEQQGEGQLSLSAWLENQLSRGKGLLSRFWNGADTAAAGEAGDRLGQEQVLAQLNDSREASAAASQSASAVIPDSPQVESAQAAHVSRAAMAAAPAAAPRTQEDTAAAAQEEGGQKGIWSRIRVRFKDITGQLAGHLKGNTSRFEAKRPFQAKQVNLKADREESRKPAKTGRDAVEIATYHVEESYLLDSYDRKGSYSKLSTKK